MAEYSMLSVIGESSLAIIGTAILAYYSLKLTFSVFRTVRAFFLRSHIDFKSHGQWAVVTGATDGIGKAYAEQLAEKGMDIILISRSAQKLQAVASAIEGTHKVKTKIVVADFSKGPEIYLDIERQLAGLDIGILVNNVGVSFDYPEYFHLVPKRDQTCAAMINCNVLSVTEMTGLVLPHMLSKKKGVIINIGSTSANFIAPLVSVYCGTKGYVANFTRALQMEYGSQGILIQLVEPMYVVTNMSKLKSASIFTPMATSFVRDALGSVGVLSETTGCFSHWLQSSLVSLAMPLCLQKAVTFRIMLNHRSSALLSAAKHD